MPIAFELGTVTVEPTTWRLDRPKSSSEKPVGSGSDLPGIRAPVARRGAQW
jgi:hypothetical protein